MDLIESLLSINYNKLKKRFIKKIIPLPIYGCIKKQLIRSYRRSYAQCGEDMILDIILNLENGFYIDIGANNPSVQSNTMYFYKKGWRGINIDATPGSMKQFNRLRKRDINLEAALASKEKEIIFYLFNSSFFNTFNRELIDQREDKIIATKLLRTVTLKQILDKYLNVTVIDFLSIDTEGNDYDILLSNDWLKYRPKVIVVEYITYVEGNRSKNKQIKALLENVGYFLFCLSVTNAFFLEKNYSLERFGINKNYLTIEE